MSSKSDVIVLKHEVEYRIPSKCKHGELIPEAIRLKAVEYLSQRLTAWFGAQERHQPRRGQWPSETTGSLMEEPVDIISSYISSDAFKEHEQDLHELAVELADRLSQELYALVIDGTMYLHPQSDPSAPCIHETGEYLEPDTEKVKEAATKSLPPRDIDKLREVHLHLSTLESKRDAIKLFCNALNYDYEDSELPTRSWDNDDKALFADPPLVIASGASSTFEIIYTKLDDEELFRTPERRIINLLIGDHDNALFLFSNKDCSLWDFINVKQNSTDTGDDGRRKIKHIHRRIRIGDDEKLRTSTERISKLELPDTDSLSVLDIQKLHNEAFDVEKVTKKFFDGYRALFNNMMADLEQQTDDQQWAHDYALLFLNRIMFLYFIQKKSWLGDDPDFINTMWQAYRKDGTNNDSFFDKWLKLLFFEAFNEQFHGGHRHLSDNIREALSKAPFLNGGLFTENELDKAHSFVITDSLIQQILGFFNSYNFTISEDSPFDQEVAVDPEMIGKVYESLVNVTEMIDERGDAGIFYTSRTEIELMCRLSLVDNLANHLGESHKPLLYRLIFAFTEDEKDVADKEAQNQDLWPEIDKHLRSLTIVDPACGSGSFLIGMLGILNDLFKRAEDYIGNTEKPYDRKKRIIGQSLYGVDVMQWAVDIAELRLWLQLVVDTEIPFHKRKLQALLPNLDFKIRQGDSLIQEVGGVNFSHSFSLETLSKSLKGKLRKLKADKLEFYSGQKGKFSNAKQIKDEEIRLFREILDSRSDDVKKEIKKLKTAVSATEFDLLGNELNKLSEKEINFLDKQISSLEIELEKAVAARKALRKAKTIPFVWDIAFVEIFGGDKAGFDIVIGNPPYVRQEQIADPTLGRDEITTENKKEYKQKLIRSVYQKYPVYFGRDPDRPHHKLDAKSDLYIYFYFHGLSLLNETGTFCFITSNSWLDVGYGKNLQEFLLNQSHVKLILDNQAKRSFKDADVNTVIALFAAPNRSSESGLKQTARFVMFKLPFENALSPILFEEIDEARKRASKPEYRINPVKQDDLLGDGWTWPEDVTDDMRKKSGRGITGSKYTGNKWGGKYLRAPDVYWSILEKGKDNLRILGEITDLKYGIKTGANEFFYLDKEMIAEWGIERRYLKPVLKSPRECKKISIDSDHLNYMVLSCHKDKKSLKGTNALKYIKWGEKQKFHRRPSCRGRMRWWDLDEITGNSVFVKEGNVTSAVFENSKSFAVDCRLYVADLAPISFVFLNSLVAAMFFEIYNRAGLGEGARSLMVEDYRKIPVLVIDPDKKKTLRAVKSIKDLPPRNVLDYDPGEWDQVDDIVFNALNLGKRQRKDVINAAKTLVEIRLDKAGSV